MEAKATAYSNIALVKYWGKRDEALILPTNPSLSMTVDAIFTTTSVRFDESRTSDAFRLDGGPAGQAATRRVTAALDHVRALAGTRVSAAVDSVNSGPTAAGLASSASGFAALVTAAAAALGLELNDTQLSILARRGSGSASRSIHGGFVQWQMGVDANGHDSHGVQVADENHWDIVMIAACVDAGTKDVSSRDGMRRTVDTSPFYRGWLDTVDRDLENVRRGILERDFELLGTAAESNGLKMHATTLAAQPPFTYWLPASLEVMQTVRELRESGVAAYFTMDAGPHVVVLCQPGDAAVVDARLRELPGVKETFVSHPGPRAQATRVGE